jgi:hypothetical protein
MKSSVLYSIRSSSGLHRLAWYALWVAALASLNACGPRYVAAPDSPMLILQAKGSVRVAMLDGADMVDIGWIDAAELEGQTVVQYDWVNHE